MNLHGLRLFYETVNHGSITKAADVMMISQPAVSSQLKKFEEEIGVKLFEKNGRRLQPSLFGRELAEKSASLFALEENIETFIQDFAEGKSGKLHIAATYLPANFLLPKWAAKFKYRYKDMDIKITTTNSTGAAKLIEDYKADFAVYGGSVEHQSTNVFWEEIAEDELWFVVSSDHPLANQTIVFQELMKEPFVMREEGSSTRARLLSLCNHYNVKEPDFGLQFNGLHEVIHSVMEGYGANFVSALAVKDYVREKKLARVFVRNIELKNKIAVGTRRNEQNSPAAKNFIRLCKEESKKITPF